MYQEKKEKTGNLCLTLKTNEVVFLDKQDKQIVLKVTQINRNQVRLLFNAPKSIKIVREELLLKKSNCNE